jgi:PadR family transcriptional regulator, regulatory protein PadR
MLPGKTILFIKSAAQPTYQPAGLRIGVAFEGKKSRHSTPMGVECLHPIVQTKEPYKNRIELLQGTLDMLVLQTLPWRPRHGYAIAHPAAAWRTTENRQRARFYSLTAKGKKQLAAEHAKWSQMVEAIAALMSREPRGQQA